MLTPVPCEGLGLQHDEAVPASIHFKNCIFHSLPKKYIVQYFSLTMISKLVAHNNGII